MAYEKDCDDVLAVMFSRYVIGNATIIQNNLIKENVFISDNDLKPILAILDTEGFIERGYKLDNKNVIIPASVTYSITIKGIAFSKTDTFVKRAERWELDKKIKEQQIEINKIELFVKGKTFYIAVAGFLLALFTFLKISCNNKSDNDKSNKPPTDGQNHISNVITDP